MNTPDEIQSPTPTPDQTTAPMPPPEPVAVADMETVPAPADPAPAEATAPAEAAPVDTAPPEVPAVASEPVKPAKAVRKPKPAISDETLAAWQAKLAAENAAKRRAAREALAARERTTAFRELRAALRRLEAEPATPAGDDLAELRADRLAMDVHEAPERVRTVIAATLRMLTRKRGR